MPDTRPLLATLLTAACAREAYDVADLQVDVEGAVPAAAETLRICVADMGTHEEGAGNGRVAVPGLRVDTVASVVVSVLDADGVEILETEAVTVTEAAPWATATRAEPDGLPCDAGGRFARDDEASWLLAVRFAEEAW